MNSSRTTQRISTSAHQHNQQPSTTNNKCRVARTATTTATVTTVATAATATTPSNNNKNNHHHNHHHNNHKKCASRCFWLQYLEHWKYFYELHVAEMRDEGQHFLGHLCQTEVPGVPVQPGSQSPGWPARCQLIRRLMWTYTETSVNR